MIHNELTVWEYINNDGVTVFDYEIGDSYFDGYGIDAVEGITNHVDAKAGAIEYAAKEGYKTVGQWVYNDMNNSWKITITSTKTTTTMEKPIKKSIKIEDRSPIYVFRMRGTATSMGDRCRDWTRVINGKKFDFSIVEWADDASRATITVRKFNTTIVVHKIEIAR